MTRNQREALIMMLPMLAPYVDARALIAQVWGVDLDWDVEEVAPVAKTWVFVDAASKWTPEVCDECHHVVPIVHTRMNNGTVRCGACLLVRAFDRALVIAIRKEASRENS